MRRNVGFFLGILLCIGGFFLIQFAYRSWQHYFMGGAARLTGIIEPVIGGVAVFFIATLMFTGDEFYKHISVRRSALFFGILLVFGGIFGVVGAFRLLYIGLTTEPLILAYAFMFGLGACLAFGTAIILLLRVREAGWLKRK